MEFAFGFFSYIFLSTFTEILSSKTFLLSTLPQILSNSLFTPIFPLKNARRLPGEGNFHFILGNFLARRSPYSCLLSTFTEILSTLTEILSTPATSPIKPLPASYYKGKQTSKKTPVRQRVQALQLRFPLLVK